MIVVKRAWRVVSPGFDPGDVEVRSRHEDRAAAEAEADRLNRSDGSAVPWYRAEPCFVLEIPQEKGPSLFFDLGRPVDVR